MLAKGARPRFSIAQVRQTIMSNFEAYASTEFAAVTAQARKPDVLHSTHAVAVEIADGSRLAALRPAWIDLLARADVPNALMDPVMVRAAADNYPEEPCRSLLAWKPDDGRRRLVGVWAFSVGRAHQSAFPTRVLNIPPGPHHYLATPVIDRSCLDDTLAAIFDMLAAEPTLPKIVALDAMGTDSPTMEALTRVLTARGSTPCILQQSCRPKLASPLDGKTYLENALSSSSRKKLRQHRRRLAEKGTLSAVIASEPAAVRNALEDFLAMEASGWKGRCGTALLSSEADASFMRTAIVAMAELGCASVHALQLDQRPVSMQIVLRAGPAAFTWKTTYDEQYQDYSPGMLLLEEYTQAFLADKTVAYVDSCAQDDSGFMSAWTERQPIADLWIDVRRGGSLEFRLLGNLQRLYRDLRASAKDAYANLYGAGKRQGWLR
jgi:CelD/BcsL family acetyltransferase involved in cellulose biosynthesis